MKVEPPDTCPKCGEDEDPWKDIAQFQRETWRVMPHEPGGPPETVIESLSEAIVFTCARCGYQLPMPTADADNPAVTIRPLA